MLKQIWAGFIDKPVIVLVHVYKVRRIEWLEKEKGTVCRCPYKILQTVYFFLDTSAKNLSNAATMLWA
jgi:hypothetical protein